MEALLKVGLIGCNSLVYNFVYDCTKHLPISLSAICDPDEERTAKFAQRYNVLKTYSDYNEMLDQEHLDAVISFPEEIDTHYMIVKACLQSAVHVLTERPACLTSKEARELLELQRKTNCYVMQRLNKRYTPAYIMAKEILQREEFGELTMYLAKYQASEYESEHAFIYKHIIHHLDLARYLMGEISLTHVDVKRVDRTRLGFNISFVNELGAIGMLQTSSLQDGSYPMEQVEITGVGHLITIDNIRSVEYRRPGGMRKAGTVDSLYEKNDTLKWSLNNGHMSNFSYIGFENLFNDFVHIIVQGKPPSADLVDAVKTIELVEELCALMALNSSSGVVK
ncbi:Gfo/Idh/MocA family protein [Paenibacillus agricola]|uniref:Gfo/Idh/MocA family oxidoreductase n=1 Tax=Paenibacillus agricola TaxID=2716264 RepID=A0ABX0J9V2_9BACL|nr:Gfo/Idh/MocA family oxidoreductase [Paenibacillus agricola]NHN32723.1 Gfo/Idh/MocA family oxidoreductase [Paenibacillus agricola]